MLRKDFCLYPQQLRSVNNSASDKNVALTNHATLTNCSVKNSASGEHGIVASTNYTQPKSMGRTFTKSNHRLTPIVYLNCPAINASVWWRGDAQIKRE